MSKPPFKRYRKFSKEDRTDNKGTVTVNTTLRKNGAFVKGSLSRSITIHDVSVSEVVKVIEEALFGDGG